MTFLSLSADWQGVLSFWSGTLELLLLFDFFGSLRIGRGKFGASCLLLCIANYGLVDIMLNQSYLKKPIPLPLPLGLLLVLLLFITVTAVAQQVHIVMWRKNHVTAMSIRNAVDVLPAGLCYALPNGLSLLVNEKMEELVEKILGDACLDAKTIWERLEKGQGKGLLRAGTECIYQLPDGKIFGFHREKIVLEEGTVMLIRATDVTREYSLAEELSEKQKKAKNMNVRLKSLMSTIEYVTMSRELLNLKVALHDNLGRSLLTARRFLLNPQSVEPKELLDLWRVNMQHLIGESPEEWQIPYYIARKEASSLGIDLQVVGNLPEEDKWMPLIDQAISAHVINVLRHADGKTAMVLIEEKESEYRLSFTNDGRPPQGEIQMTGGLGNLKRKVEETGGRMEISSAPRFEMRLTLPKISENKTE